MDTSLGHLNILFSKIILTDEHYFCVKSKKLMFGQQHKASYYTLLYSLYYKLINLKAVKPELE